MAFFRSARLATNWNDASLMFEVSLLKHFPEFIILGNENVKVGATTEHTGRDWFRRFADQSKLARCCTQGKSRLELLYSEIQIFSMVLLVSNLIFQPIICEVLLGINPNTKFIMFHEIFPFIVAVSKKIDHQSRNC